MDSVTGRGRKPAREGVPEQKIACIGNIMIDSFEMLRGKIESADTRLRLGLDGKPYAVVTLAPPVECG